MILTQKMQAVHTRWEADGKLACRAKVPAIYFYLEQIHNKNPEQTSSYLFSYYITPRSSAWQESGRLYPCTFWRKLSLQSASVSPTNQQT